MTTASKGFTGRHMLLTTVGFFGVVVAVNVTMAYVASSSWSGLVVENTYVASQRFNEKAEAMRALALSGVKGSVAINGGVFSYTLKNRDGSPADADTVRANFRRPVGDHEDFGIDLNRAGDGRFDTKHRVPAGVWIVEFVSRRGDSVVMHEALRFDTAGFGE